ncbi:MAG: tape measure protein [Sporolactobacillus sp.]
MVQNAAAIASMVVHIGLDKTEMTQGLTAMKNTVRAATAEWKTQFSVFNQLGDHVKAAETKYKGLTTAIEAQKKVIDQERSQLSNLGTRTKDNADAYDKLSSQINQNANKLAGLTSQQEKARKMYEYEQSGIRGNKEELSLLAREMQSTVNMYKAQGDEEKANAAQAEGLQKQIANLVNMKEKEQSILEEVKAESGKSSSAYREQAIRVAELSTRIAHAKSEYDDIGNSSEKSASRLDRFKDAASKTHSIFAGSFFGTLAGNAFTKFFSGITEGAHSIIDAGKEENETLESIHNTWTNFTHSAKDGEEFTKIIEEMHEQSHYSLDSISALNKMMYGLTGNKKGMEELSESIQHVGRAAGLNDSQIDAIGKKLTQVGVNGKLSYSDVAKMTKQIPGFAKVMADTVGVSQDKLVAMGKAGKLTGKDFQETMENMGKANSNSFKNYDHTTAGFAAAMHDTWDKLSQRLMKPIFNMQKSGLSSLTKFAQSKDVERAFSAMGVAISQAMGKAATGVSQFIKYIQAHKQTITGIIDEIKSGISTVWKIAEPVINFLIEHPKLLVGVATGIMLMSPALKAFSLSMKIASLSMDTFKVAARDALISSGIGAAVVLLGIAAVELITHWKQVSKFFSNLWKDIKSLFSSGVSFVKKHAELFIAALGPIGWAIDGVIEIVKHWGSIAKTVTKAWDGVASFFSGVWKKIEKGGSSLLSWFKKLPSRMWSNVKGGFKKLGSWIKNIWDDASAHVSSGWKSLSSWFKKLPGRIWSSIKSNISDLWSGMKWLSSHVWDRIEDWGSDLWKWMKKLPGRVWSNIKSNASDLWSGIKWLGSHAYDRFKSWGTDIIDWFKKLPGRMASGIKNGAKALGNAGIFIGNKLIDGVQKVINGVIDGIDWLGNKVGLGKHLIKPASLPNIGYFAEGTYDSTGKFLKDTLIHVGDGNKKEIVRHKDGTLDLTPNRDTLMVAKRGDSILGGDKTEQLLKMLPHFSMGSFFGSIGDFVKGGWNTLKSGASAVWDALSHPTQLFNTVMDKFAGSAVGNLSGAMANVGEGIVKTMIKNAGKIVDNLFGGASDPGGSGVQRWVPDVKRALGMLGLSTSESMISRVLRQIKTESGGNPKALGGDDGLADGRAMGLMQVKPGTFAAYHLKGFADIWKGFDNMIAGLNYAKHRYGSGLSFLGQGHGYKNGGLVTTAQIASIAEGNKAEMVIPLTNQNRALQLMYQALDYFKGNSSSGSQQSQQQTTVDNSQLIQVLQQTNQLIASFMQLVDQKPTGITNQQVYNANKQVSDQNTRIRNLAMGMVN